MTENHSCALGELTTQGVVDSRTFWSWASMLERCLSRDSRAWRHYGGRGITVCDRWLLVSNFLADMGSRPEGMTLDRIDNNGNYEPGNCRWASPATQARNTRRNRFVELSGQRMTHSEAARALGVSEATIMRRVDAGRNPSAPPICTKLTDSQRLEVVALVESGLALKEVASRYGITRQAVWQIAK